MEKNPLVKPFLKWAGGKRYLIPEIQKYWPKSFRGTYFEPFLGGGAVLLAFQPRRAVVNDINPELINCYTVVRDAVEDLITCMREFKNNEEAYYEVRKWDRAPSFRERSTIERAARIIYLNKTCYNGLFRVNSQGQFNAPFGKYTSPTIIDETVVRAVSRYFQQAEISFRCGDFADALAQATRGDFVYIDPPYDAKNETSFTHYGAGGFDRSEQQRLSALVGDLHQRGCKVLLSNAATESMRAIYAGMGKFVVETVAVPRPINSSAGGRGKVNEILVRNY
jgi:DNA adenine methylase